MVQDTPTFDIIPELAQVFEPVPKITDEQLEANLIKTGGPIDPIRVWKWQGKNILVDGHRRYGVCKRLGLPITKIDYVDFEDIEEAQFWMRFYQNSRRNQTPTEYALNIARQVEYLHKRKHQGYGGKSRAVAEVAKNAGVTERAVYRALNYADALDSLEPDVRSAVISGEAKATNQQAVLTLASLGPVHQRAIIAGVANGTYKNLSAAVLGDGDGVEEEAEDNPLEDDAEIDKAQDEKQDEAEGTQATPAPTAQQPKTTDAASVTSPQPAAAPAGKGKGKSADAAGAKAGASRPSPKPMEDIFKQSQKELGGVFKHMETLRKGTRWEDRYAACRKLAVELSDALDKWEGDWNRR